MGIPVWFFFGDSVTPNHHALARDFILFDNFFVDGGVSADGHVDGGHLCGAALDYSHAKGAFPAACVRHSCPDAIRLGSPAEKTQVHNGLNLE